jgi:hypothetical protein
MAEAQGWTSLLMTDPREELHAAQVQLHCQVGAAVRSSTAGSLHGHTLFMTVHDCSGHLRSLTALHVCRTSDDGDSSHQPHLQTQQPQTVMRMMLETMCDRVFLMGGVTSTVLCLVHV